jgi:K+-transporting ATPase ATPase A chain
MDILINVILPFGLLFALVKPLGRYMARVYTGQKPTWLEKKIGFCEQWVYRLCGISPQKEMGWRGYTLAILAFSAVCFIFLFVIFTSQGFLPLNPRNVTGLPADQAFNAAVGFISNANWQSYSGEVSLSYFAQMVGCAVHNLLSAACSMAVAVALFRAIARRQAQTIGNAWVDITRGLLYILLPLSFCYAVFLASQGAVQTFSDYVAYAPLEQITPPPATPPTIALGPVASQAAAKMIASAGGGFFNANAAHPFENPTPLANLMQFFSILLLPAGLIYAFGIMVGDRRQGWALIAAMTLLFVPLMTVGIIQELQGNPRFDPHVIDTKQGNMEGKEVRIGAINSVTWAAATTATANGSVNSAHASFMPLGGLVPMVLIQSSEVIFGGVGSGAYCVLMLALLTVFIGGLMVGRTPEIMGKKLGAFEIKMACIVILLPCVLVLLGTAIAVSTQTGRSSILNPGAQGFSEVLYAFSSAAVNNGSAFAGLSTNTLFYNIGLGICMLMGRFGIIIPALAVAGSMVSKNIAPTSAGTLPTHTPLFIIMLMGTVIMMGMLAYIPALALGPIAEHFHLFAGAR